MEESPMPRSGIQQPILPKSRVLIVDDRPANLLTLRALLEDIDADIVEATSGVEALRHLDDGEFAVVLLDVVMPVMNGFEVAQRLRERQRTRHTPIMFITAAEMDQAQMEKGYELGVVDFLVKPIAGSFVRAKVRGFVEIAADNQRARREAEQLRLLIEGTTDYAIFMLDPNGNVVTWNSGAERLKGYTASEIIGQHFSQFYPLEAVKSGWPLYELTTAQERGSFEDEGWRVRKDGSLFWANVVITALFDEHNRLQGFSKVTRDLTVRKESEERAKRLLEEATARRLAEQQAEIIQQQRERLHVTLASIGDGVISTDAEGKIEFLNSVAEHLTGWNTAEAKDLPLEQVFQIVNETSRLTVENPALRAIKEGVIVGLANHTILIAKDGTERPIDDSAAPIRDAHGKLLGSVLVFRDITERKRAERTAKFLADASAALAVLIDFNSTIQTVASLAVPHFADWSAVDLLDEKGAVRRVAVAHVDPAKVELAKELERRFPTDLESLQGVAKVIRTGEAQLVREISDERLAASVKNPEQLTLLRSLGLTSYLGVPLKVRGQIIGAITFVTAESGYHYRAADLSVAQDLAERSAIAIENARLYRELREADRRKDEFLATLAHELRNPLAPIRNSLQILKMPRVDAATAQQTREMMERQIHHLVRLVDDLLDVSRVMRGQIDLRKETVELATIVARAVETAKPLIEAHGHRLDLDVSTEPLPLNADPVRLVQALGNLLNNSAKYSEDNGRIQLSATSDKGEAVIKIRDQGIGIDKEMLPRIFDLFVQADHASTKAQGGLGIGLTLVKNLIEMHGGTVSAHSDGLGKGAEFVVRLPLTKCDSPANEEMIADRSTPVTPGHRLMVVDDNQDAALSLSMLLKLQGHDVRIANSGQTALQLAADFVPEAIFLDIGMPGMDGYEVARRILSSPRLEQTLLIALTGWGQQDDRRRTTEAGFHFHLVKPPEPEAIDEILAVLQK